MLVCKDGLVVNLLYCSAFNIFDHQKTEIAFWIANTDHQRILFTYSKFGLAEKAFNHITELMTNPDIYGIGQFSMVDCSEQSIMNLA